MLSSREWDGEGDMQGAQLRLSRGRHSLAMHRHLHARVVGLSGTPGHQAMNSVNLDARTNWRSIVQIDRVGLFVPEVQDLMQGSSSLHGASTFERLTWARVASPPCGKTTPLSCFPRWLKRWTVTM